MSEVNTSPAIQLLAGLAITDSEKQILQDIKTIQKRLEQAGAKFKLTAEMDNDLLKAIREMSNSKDVKNLGKSMADTLISQFNIVDKESQKLVRNLSNQLQTIRIGELTSGNIDDSLLKVVNELGEAVVNSSNTIKSRLGIYDEFYNYFKKLGKISISDSIKSDLGADWNELRKLYSSKFTTNSNNGIELDSIYQEMSSKFKDIFSGVANPTDQFRELSQAIKNYRADVDQIEPITQSIELEDSVVQSIYTELAKLEAAVQLDGVKESMTAISGEASALEKVENSAKLASQQKEKFADANREVRETAEDTTAAVNREVQAFLDMNDLDQILANINMHGQQGNSVFQAFGTTLRDAFYAFTAANLLEDAIHEVIDAGKESVEVVKELNDAATSLRMATGSSYESVKALITSYNVMGQEIGALTTEVSDSADAWLRQGHTLSDTNTLIKDSMMLSKVTNMDAAKSTKYLTSAMQGYKTSVEEVVAICDRLVSIDLVSATDSAGLAEAMSRTAEGANIAGVSMDRLLGMIAATGEVTQKSMSSIGESYKTIFSRMRDVKDNKLQVVGDDGEIEDLSNVEVVLNSLGIKLRESNHEFRNFQDVLDEVAAGWNNYSSVQQAAIAKAFSGVRQQENFLVMMENWDKVLEYTKAAENSTGMTEEKFGYYLDSLEAKTKSLQASLENLASTTISEELYASILDTAKAMTDATTESGILKSSLTGLASAGALYSFQQLGGFVHNCAQEFSNLSVAMNLVQAGNIGQDELQAIIDLTGGLSQSQTRLLLSTNTLTDAQRVAILMNQGLTQAQAEAQIQTWGLVTAQNGLTTATISLGNVMRGLWSTLMANPLILVATGVTAGVTAFNKYKQSVEEAKQATKESATKATELSAELSNLTNEYLRLNEEVKENASVKDELLGVQDDLLEKLGLEKSELDELIEKYGSYSEAIKNASIDKLKESQVDMVSGLGVAKDEMIDSGRNNFLGNRNIITASGKDANKAFEVLEQAGIVEVGDNLYLDGDDTVEGALENYAKLESALEALRNSNKFTLAELSDNPLYKAIYDRWSEMKAPVEEYNTSIEELNTNQAAIMTLESLKGTELPDTQESFDVFKQGLIDSATASKDFIGTEEEIITTVDNYLATVPEFAQFYSEQFRQMGEDANSAASALSNATKSQAIEKINSLADGFSALQDIYNDISSGDGLDIADLSKSGFTDAFSGVTESYENFISVVTNSPNDIKACQAAFDDLLFSWLNSEDILSVLNDETIELIGNMLEEQGVTNASAWLADELSARKQFAAGATNELTDATATEIKAFFDEIEAADGVKEALARLELAKITLNGTVIDTSGDVSNLIALAEQANATKEALAKMKSYQKISQDYGQTVGDDIFAEDVAAEREGFTNAIKSTINYKPSEGKGSAINSGSGYNPQSSSSKSSSSSSSKAPKQDIIDWIETKITRCNEQIERLETKLAELPTRLQKNPHINTIIDEETEKLNILQQAYDEYMKSASESADKNGLKHEYVMKVQNGTIDIEQISDDSIKNAISEYQDLYNKALAANVEITATTTKIKELKVQKLDNIANDYDNITSLIDSIYNYKEGLISLKEKAREEIFEEDYTNLISYQNSIYEANKREYEELLSEFNKLVDDGTISKYSDQWFDYTQQLHETNAELTESQEAIEDLRDSIIELRLKPLQDYKDSLDSINGGYETLLSLIGDEDLMNGSMITDRGLAQLAIYGQQLGMAKQEVEEYSNAIKSVSAMYENGTITVDEYNERIYDLRNAHESAISSVQKAREAILQFRYDAIQGQIEDMQELTQSRIDDLNQMKENEDYAKEISDKQKNISVLEKKIAVLSLSTNRADMAMKLQLEQELADAREELAETQADHELDKTIEKLEDENKAYEKAKNEELKELKTNLNKQDEIIESYLGKVKDNYDSVYDTLNKYGEAYNLENTKDLTSPWENADSAMNSFVTSLADAVSKINISISNIETGKLNELSSMVGDLSNASNTSNNYKTAGNNWKWQQGQGGKWWYGEDYREDGDYAYASGGIYNINGKQYKFDNEGYMITGWQQDNNDNWTYFETDDDNGQMVKSQWRQHSDGKWYYLTHDGTMAKDAIVENRDGNGYYYVDKNGVWDESLGVNGLLPEEEALKLSKYRAYKKGTKRVEAEQFAWTQDGGREVIARKDGGILTKLYPGDGVIPHNMAENLFAWSEYNPLDVFKRSYAHISQPSMSGNGVVIGDIHNEFNITGDADSVLKVVKKYATGPMWDDIKNKTKMYGR